MTSPTPETTPPRRGVRAPFLAGAVATGLLAAVLLLAGTVALIVDGHKDADGYLTTDSQRFATATAALATENLDVDLDGVSGSDLGTLRLKVTSQSGKPVFAGVARTRDVEAYLGRVAHATLTDIDVDPFVASYDAAPGVRRAVPPATRGIWSATAHGAGTQTLKWDLADGDWSVVVMNRDGSPGVAANITAGARAPWLDEAGWGVLGGGLLMLAATGGLLLAGLRPRRG